ncbi:TetR/AcrR family transcriptional regulator [Nonomuraea rhodomycinica]|uniref:TetR/AcrR family transcriptional regulator n=1 Tax=Nonomuraea rhodomycinica TaxID=1712872 RepID=A0A7Y6IJ05_9ACTN|nr:TetR/AcrR family transcriptional regulator [Nonomuraea rhodomycinica]
MSDDETARRMLAAAVARVEEAGLTVSLEHISFEEVIRDAGVARSAAYRRWPYKDLFFGDLLRELARGASPAITDTNPGAVETVARTLLASLHWARTPGLRRALAGEVLRESALGEFEAFHRSSAWRTYLALQATFRGLPDGVLRAEVQQSFAESERSLVAGVAAAYARMATLIGLRPCAGVTFETAARTAIATLRGLILMAPGDPDLTVRRFRANPFGAPEPAEWSEPALAIASVVLALVEADPDVPWTDEHERSVATLLRSGRWAARG